MSDTEVTSQAAPYEAPAVVDVGSFLQLTADKSGSEPDGSKGKSSSGSMPS